MELKPNMYVRTEDGEILKIKHTEDVYTSDDEYVATIIYFGDCFHINSDEIVKKPSYNIIDLIEVGDYVNGERVTRVIPQDICGDEILDYQHVFVNDKELFVEDIKSIVTKEQFESMSYKVGE